MLRGPCAAAEGAFSHYTSAINRNKVNNRKRSGSVPGQRRVSVAAIETSVLLHVSTNKDGTITYSFGADVASTACSTTHTHASHVAHTPDSQHIPQIPPRTLGLRSLGEQSLIPMTAGAHGPEAASQLDRLLHITPAVAGVATSPSPSKSSSMSGSSYNNGARRLREDFESDTRAHSIAAEPLSLDPKALSYDSTHASSILKVYSGLCMESRLDDALLVMKDSIRAGRVDVLKRLKHSDFLRAATEQASVRHALRFVQLLPRQFVDARTYNMLVSVCAKTGDVRNALRAADMLRSAGLKLDTILYTNLIKVCAKAGEAEPAFDLFREMQSTGVRMEKQCFSVLISACSEQIAKTHTTDRRKQLVLLERAFGLVDAMDAARVQPDAAVWNSLITAAGRAGQLQRAFDVLDEMLSRASKPNGRTYASLVDACARTGDKDLALRVYKRALREGFVGELRLYSSAIHACVKARDGADLDAAISVYSDMQRNGVSADSALYGVLMMAAGGARNLELTLDLQAEMEREGLRPCNGTESALLTVYVQNGQLAEAQKIYLRMRTAGTVPHLHAINALLNAHAKALRLGDVVSLVCDVIGAGMVPDAFTFAAVLNACQRSDECELGLDVYRAMRLRNVRLDEVHTSLLLKMCYSRLRQTWQQGGYPPTHAAAMAGSSSTARLPVTPVTTVGGGRRAQQRAKLLEALAPPGRTMELREPSVEVPWQGHAFQIYREAVIEGVRPSMDLINRMLMCLRVPWSSSSRAGDQDLAAQTQQLHAGMHPTLPVSAPIQRKIGVESVYHVQAMSILEEAIISGNLPGFNLTDSSQAPFDLRSFPPAVAEVYALTVVSSLQRQIVEGRRQLKHRVVFLVPRYDGRQVFRPSFASQSLAVTSSTGAHPISSTSEAAGVYADDIDSDSEMEELELAMKEQEGKGNEAFADDRTGLGVAGVLRRLRLWAREYSPEGLIILEPRELGRWSKVIQREVEKRSLSALPLQKPYGQSKANVGGLVGQSRSIRTMGF